MKIGPLATAVGTFAVTGFALPMEHQEVVPNDLSGNTTSSSTHGGFSNIIDLNGSHYHDEYINLAWPLILLPLLTSLDNTTNTTMSVEQGRAQLDVLATDPTIDFDSAIESAITSEMSRQSLSSSANLDKRATGAHCGVHMIIFAECTRAHHCFWECIIMPANFPYRTCKAFLINGKCPQGLQGMGSLKPAAPMQEYQNAPPQNHYYDADP